jgi:integrase
MATFRQREGRWQAIIRRVDLKATRTFDRLKDAQVWAREQERAADRGEHAGEMLGTLGPLIEKYERKVWKDKRWGPSKTHELKMLRQDLGNRPLKGLSKTVVLNYANGLDLTPGGVSGRLSYLREVLRTARDLWGVRVPLADLDAAISAARRMKIAGGSNVRTRRPTRDELDAIKAYGRAQTTAIIDLAAVVDVLEILPLRAGELVGIQWPDLNDERRTSIIRGRKHPDINIKEQNDQEVPLITFKGVDTYHLIADRPRYLPSPFPYNRGSLSTAFGMAALRLGIKDLHLHDLRAHALSGLLEAGVPIPQVALISGHRNWKVLAKHYARIDPVSVHDAIGRLPK